MGDVFSPLFVGIDESNHGRFPEFFVSVHSALEKDIIERPKIPKERNNHSRLFGKFSRRNYTFLTINEIDYGRIPSRELIGVITASLLQRDVPEYTSYLKILIDGLRTQQERFYLREVVSEICDFERARITVLTGVKFDQKYNIVNIADEMAHYLFRRTSQEISLNKHKRYLVM